MLGCWGGEGRRNRTVGRKGTRDRGEGRRDIAEGTRNRSQSPEEKGGEENTILTSQARPDSPDGFTFWSPSEPLTKHAALLSILLSTRCASPFSCLQGPPSLFPFIASYPFSLVSSTWLFIDYTFPSFHPQLLLSSLYSYRLAALIIFPSFLFPSSLLLSS